MSDTPDPVAPADARRIRVAARAVARAGLVHAYGHCSLRLNPDRFIVSAPKPLGLIGIGEQPITVPIAGALPPEALGEVVIHQHIYGRRDDVGGIVRFQSPSLTVLSAFPPLYPNPRLVRDAAGAAALVEQLGPARGIVMRGNGAVTVGASIEEAVVMAWYLEDAARVELAVRGTGLEGPEFTPAEAGDRAITAGRIMERMWDWLTANDPE